jgi:hypothetical protein
MATIRDDHCGATLSANSAWFSTDDTTVTAGADGARHPVPARRWFQG